MGEERRVSLENCGRDEVVDKVKGLLQG